ncbi:hypothetical protein GCM10010873_30830 [Cypionkella aquatica]|uniref:DUF805 domain-containing protein n=1 Tax=Cypionkella aquatica TaxID=1756042 RepID=A0AA37TVJ3_9RHOB|nr:DUF805 domain-containing protein [Cypionkella aquatica]GLS88109.1 hypothetical protein GCM10010873_30830 [Cypionkella aquatica]
MGPAQAIGTCLRKSFQYSGRASRAEYWCFLPVGLILPMAALAMLNQAMPDSPTLLRGLVFFLTLSPLMAVTRRRLTDTGEASFWFETPLMALVFALTSVWAIVGLTNWALDPLRDGPGMLGVLLIWLTGVCVLIPAFLHQFFLGLITGSALFSQMAAPSRQVKFSHRPNPTEASK